MLSIDYNPISRSPQTPVHDLIPLSATLPGALTIAEIDATMGYAAAEKAQATRAAYASDWRDFLGMSSRGRAGLAARLGRR